MRSYQRFHIRTRVQVYNVRFPLRRTHVVLYRIHNLGKPYVAILRHHNRCNESNLQGTIYSEKVVSPAVTWLIFLLVVHPFQILFVLISTWSWVFWGLVVDPSFSEDPPCRSWQVHEPLFRFSPQAPHSPLQLGLHNGFIGRIFSPLFIIGNFYQFRKILP